MVNFVQDRRENKLVLVYTVIYILTNKYLKRALNSNIKAKTSFITSVDKILSMSKISDELKNEIRNKGSQLKFINYEF